MWSHPTQTSRLRMRAVGALSGGPARVLDPPGRASLQAIGDGVKKMPRVVWYETVLLGLAAVALMATLVEFVRPEGEGVPFAFIAAGVLLVASASMLVRRRGELPPVSWYEIALVGLAGAALVVSVVEFARRGGDAGVPFSLATVLLVLLAFGSRLLRPRVSAR